MTVLPDGFGCKESIISGDSPDALKKRLNIQNMTAGWSEYPQLYHLLPLSAPRVWNWWVQHQLPVLSRWPLMC